MKYSPNPRFDTMPLDELRGIDIDELNVIERLQVKRRIDVLEQEAAKSTATAQSWYQKWSFWVGIAALLIALISMGLSLGANAASQRDMLFERTEQLVRLCSVSVPDEPQIASQELLQLYKSDPVLANDKFVTGMTNFTYMSTCLGYIGGFKDMLYILNINSATSAQQIVCFPSSGVSNAQAAKILLKWAENNPEQLHKSTAVGLLLALADAFPCAN